MPHREFTYRWEWQLRSSPETLWPLVSDTNRFNRDTGVPAVDAAPAPGPLDNAHKMLQLRRFGVPIEWEEEPFEWTYPYSFGITRRYSKGPLDEMRTNANFTPLPEGGTRITYSSTFITGNILAQLGIPFGIGVIAKNRFERAFRKYDAIISRGESLTEMPRQRALSSGGRNRFKVQSEAVVKQA